jgi:hypothetical protein
MLNILTNRFNANDEEAWDVASFAVRHLMDNGRAIQEIRPRVWSMYFLARTWSLIYSYTVIKQTNDGLQRVQTWTISKITP